MEPKEEENENSSMFAGLSKGQIKKLKTKMKADADAKEKSDAAA